MNNIQRAIIEKDLHLIDQSGRWEALKGASVMVTGAGGFIGAQIIWFLDYLNRKYDYNIKILPLARDIEKVKEKLALKSARLKFIKADICRPLETTEEVDYIIHGASPTASRFFLESPVQTIMTAVQGTSNVLEFAKNKKVKNIVYLSSMEAFGLPPKDKETLKENDYGYIDILNPRSSYPQSKQTAECLCCAYAAQYALPVKIARLTQTVGPGAPYNDERMASQFARCVIENRDIVLFTEGTTLRNSIYTADAVSAILTILLKGENAHAYNTANKNAAITVRQTAQMLAHDIAKDKISVRVELKTQPHYAPPLRIKLDTTALEALGWKATTNLKEMYLSLINWMQTEKQGQL